MRKTQDCEDEIQDHEHATQDCEHETQDYEQDTRLWVGHKIVSKLQDCEHETQYCEQETQYCEPNFCFMLTIPVLTILCVPLVRQGKIVK